MDETEIEAFRAPLEALRAELVGAEGVTAEDRAPVALDQQSVGRLSRIDAIQVQAMAQEQSRRRAAQIRRIDAALARIARGEYGWCPYCGEAIGERRLKLDPAAALCIDCAGAR